jgi:hypothetical protein
MVDSKAQLLARGVFPLTSKTVRDYNGFFSLKSKLERTPIERVGKWKETN